MNKILLNLALIDLNNYCKTQNIDNEGSHIKKDGRGYKYSLISYETGKPLVSVIFTKNTVPIHIIDRGIK